ncbi:serine hydrolase domain-containing protein [Streptomyces sp. NPDC091217]|uniref:serine hydrolase domain-containing protein n=1 Tax=Streptomyces sp. NPDC091217 TaxID=3365975 RepID=UPI003814BC9F
MAADTSWGGHVIDGFEPVREAFREVIDHHPGGAALSVYRDGQEVVDLWGGVSPATGRPFTGDSLVVTMSCTKGMTTICALMLAQEGLLDLDAPVARYWPEFAQAGKGDIPVRWLLTHQAGLPALDPDLDAGPEQTLDNQFVIDTLARQEPMWEPGTLQAYHGVTFGHLVGEVIRRVSGLTAGQYLAKHVAGPLGLDYWIGLPEAEESRVLPILPADDAPAPDPEFWRRLAEEHGIDPTRPMARALRAEHFPPPADPAWNTRPYHAAEFPAVNGIGTARSLTRAYAACIGPVDGIRLLYPETVDAARTPQTDDVPLPEELAFLGTAPPPRRGLGFELPRPTVVPMLGEGSFGHTGAGGRLAFASPETGIAFAFTCDVMLWGGLDGPDPRWVPLLNALAETVRR